MASKEQYEFFRQEYQEENVRNNELTKRAEIYLSIVSLFLTAVFFKVADFFNWLHNKEIIKSITTIVLVFLILLLFSVALILIINSLRIGNYEGVCDIDAYLEINKDVYQDDEDFFENRIADYIVAVQRNEAINNKKAQALTYSRYFILMGFISTVIFIINVIISNL